MTQAHLLPQIRVMPMLGMRFFWGAVAVSDVAVGQSAANAAAGTKYSMLQMLHALLTNAVAVRDVAVGYFAANAAAGTINMLQMLHVLLTSAVIVAFKSGTRS